MLIKVKGKANKQQEKYVAFPHKWMLRTKLRHKHQSVNCSELSGSCPNGNSIEWLSSSMLV